MARYIALICDPTDSGHRSTVESLVAVTTERLPQFEPYLDTPRLKLFSSASPKSSDHMPYDGGAILGTVFDRDTSSPRVLRSIDTIDRLEARRLVSTNGSYLIDNHWGHYVALAQDDQQNATVIVRDPTGGVPCFLARHDGVYVVFSLLEDYLSLGLARPPINWRFVAARVAVGPVSLCETGLFGVTEICPGECATLTRGGLTVRSSWNPLRIAIERKLEDPGLCAQMLRLTTKMCVDAWASAYPTMLHRLSGGLDSSIVAGCLRDSPSNPSVTCLKYRLENAHWDQLSYARIASRATGFELLELVREPKLAYQDLLRSRLSVNPHQHLAFLETSRAEHALAIDRGASAVFTGEGGDAIFGGLTRRYAPSDYLRHHGFGGGLMRRCMEVARNGNFSFWAVLSQALSEGLFHRDYDIASDISIHRRCVSESLVATLKLQLPSLMKTTVASSRAVPRGTYVQAFCFTLNTSTVDPLETDADTTLDVVHPLLSQPLIELSLRIPSYVHSLQGRNRGLARRAFASDVPSEILSRLWKDHSPGFAESGFAQQSSFIKDFLLNGALVRERLLDRTRVERAMSGAPRKDVGFLTEVYDHMIVESWVQSFQRLDRIAA